MNNTQDRILRKPTVIELTGLSYSQINRMEQQGQFPRRRQITERIVGWSALEVQQWIDKRLNS